MTEKKWIDIDISEAKPLTWDNYERVEQINFLVLIPEYERLQAIYPNIEIFLECKVCGYEEGHVEICFEGSRLETDEELATRITRNEARDREANEIKRQHEIATLNMLQKKYGN